jgi:hypothetical protein
MMMSSLLFTSPCSPLTPCSLSPPCRVVIVFFVIIVVFSHSSATAAHRRDTDYDTMLSSSSSNAVAATATATAAEANGSARHYVPPAVASFETISSSSSSSPSAAAAAAAAWRTAVCPRTGKTYFWNVVTRESRWKKPLELATDEEVEQIRAKERKLREFFEVMEKNVLRRLEMGDYGSGVPGEGGGSVAATEVIDQSWMVAADSPTENDNADEDWIASWITPNSESSDAASLGSMDMEGLSVLDRAVGTADRSSTPASLDDGLSLGSGSAGREERDDGARPLLPPTAGRPQSRLERIKSSGSGPVIDKPSLIRTISKMEDVLLARAPAEPADARRAGRAAGERRRRRRRRRPR